MLMLSMIVLGGLGLVYALVEPARPWLEPPLVILTVAFAINLVAMPTWRYLVHRWEITGQAIYTLQGWLTREWRIVPVSRIQTVDVIKGPLQQILGLATVRAVTASPQGTVKIVGLDARMAGEIAAELNEITQVTPGDAT